MPLTCILCKQEYNPIDGSRSFHRFPQDKNLREKWMQIVGVSAIKSHMAICSKHFEPSSYYDTCGYTSRRRLQKTAVPILEKCSEPLILSSSQLKDLKKLTCSSQLTKDHSRNTIQEGEESCETTDSGTKRKIVSKDESGIGSEPLILASSQLKNLKKLTCSSQLTKDHSRNTIQEGKESCEITDSGTKRKIVSKDESGIGSEPLILASSQLKNLKKLTCSSQLTKDHSRNTIQEGKESCEITDSGTKRKIVSKDESGIGSEPLILASSQLKNLKKLTCSSQLTKDHSRNTIQEGKESCEITDSGTKRKIVSKNESGIHNKRIRFTHNCQMIQISREDCVSDEAWNRFMMLITYKNKQIRAARQKSNRNIKKQQRIQELLGVVKAKKNSSVTNYLQVTTK